MRDDIEDIKKLIRSRYNHYGKTISDEKIDALSNHYGETKLSLLQIQSEIEQRILTQEEKPAIFDSEEIGDRLSFLQLKQLEIDTAERVLKAATKRFSRLTDNLSGKPNKAFGGEHHIRFSSEEIGDHLSFLQLKQIDIDNAERSIKFYINQTRQ